LVLVYEFVCFFVARLFGGSGTLLSCPVRLAAFHRRISVPNADCAGKMLGFRAHSAVVVICGEISCVCLAAATVWLPKSAGLS
jgi:hypothetical protein